MWILFILLELNLFYTHRELGSMSYRVTTSKLTNIRPHTHFIELRILYFSHFTKYSLYARPTGVARGSYRASLMSSTYITGSVVGIATGYGLDGPGIEYRWGRDIPRLSRPALGPTQPSVQWVPCVSRG